jgi:hypothetical protein
MARRKTREKAPGVDSAGTSLQTTPNTPEGQNGPANASWEAVKGKLPAVTDEDCLAVFKLEGWRIDPIWGHVIGLAEAETELEALGWDCKRRVAVLGACQENKWLRSNGQPLPLLCVTRAGWDWAQRQQASAPECLVNLAQAAAMVNLSKRSLERYKPKMPPPSAVGGKGRADQWEWRVIRPWLQTTFGHSLPERFPADRFLRR